MSAAAGSISSRVLQQAGWLAMAKIVQGLCSVAATFVVARHLGPADYGSLSLAAAIASFVATTAALGLEHIATRELAEGSLSVLPVLRRMRAIGALIGSLVLVGIAYLPMLGDLAVSPLLFVLALLPLAQVGDVAEWQLIAAGRSRQVAIVVLASAPTAALVRLALAFLQAGTPAFAAALVFEWALRSVLLRLCTRTMENASDRAQDLVVRATALLRDSMPLLLSGIAIFAYMRIDQFMIAAMLGREQVGLYSAVVTLAEVPLILPALLLRAALPTLAGQAPALRDRSLMALMSQGFYLHAAMACVLALAATPIVVLLYGEAFRPAVPAFQLQVFGAPFVALGVLSSAWLVLERQTGHALRRTFAGAVVNIALNFFMIPAFGITGAAASTLIAQAIATYAADAGDGRTRVLFRMKTRALLQRPWRTT